MTDTLTAPQFARIRGYEDSAAVFDPRWLPDIDVIPELAEARREHLRLRDAWHAAGDRRSTIEAQIENDNERRKLAMRDAYLRGDQHAPEPESAELKAQHEQAIVESQAAAEAFLEHINRCIALVVERGADWFTAIDTYQQDVIEQERALEVQLEKVRRQRGDFTRLENWVERTGGPLRTPTQDRPGPTSWGADLPNMHHAYADIPAPPSSKKEADDQAQEALRAAFAGWDGKQQPLTDEQAKALEQHIMNVPQAEADVVVSPLTELDEDDLVEWIMGAGGFEGKGKPDAAAVVQVGADGGPTVAARLLKAERRANESAPRKTVVDPLEQIVGA